jgi:hypothetical protein
LVVGPRLFMVKWRHWQTAERWWAPPVVGCEEERVRGFRGTLEMLREEVEGE